MARYTRKHIRKSDKYKYVILYRMSDGSLKWRCLVFNDVSSKYFESEREAAILVDKQLIERGKDPVNILKSIL